MTDALRRNLERLLEVTLLPPPTSTAAGDAASGHVGVECAICYAYDLDGEPPGKACDNPKCAQPFHTACLCEVRFFFFRSPHPRCAGRRRPALHARPDSARGRARVHRQWLRALPTTRQSFQTLFGACPYCGEVRHRPAHRIHAGTAALTTLRAV